MKNYRFLNSAQQEITDPEKAAMAVEGLRGIWSYTDTIDGVEKIILPYTFDENFNGEGLEGLGLLIFPVKIT